MKHRDIVEMMQDIDPEFRQKAESRAAAAQQMQRRSPLPSVLVGTAAIGCAAFAAAILLPPLRAARIDTAVPQTSLPESVQTESAAEVLTEPAAECPITDFSADVIRLMSPAYAPYVLDIPAEQQQSLAAALTASEWIPYDMDAPFADGETYTVFVCNNGDSYRLTSYADQTVVLEQNGTETRWQISADAERAIAEAANPALPTDPSAVSPLTNHLTWCDIHSLNATDIWRNIRVGAKQCDMTDKRDIYYKMNNTADYFDRCSGIVKTGIASEMTRYEFQVDLNTMNAYQHEDNFYGPDAEALIAESGITDMNVSFTYALDGENYYSVNENNNCMKYPGIAHRIDSPSILPDELLTVNPASGHFDDQNRRRQLLDGIAIDCIENYRTVYDLLHDFDKWEIAGTEEIGGRRCVRLSGGFDSEQDRIKRFDLYADEETGVTVKLLGYNESGVLSRFIVVEDLAFDEDAAPVRVPDYASMLMQDAALNAPAPENEAAEAGAPVTDPPQ